MVFHGMEASRVSFKGLRRAFALDLYDRSGGNLGLVRELLGQGGDDHETRRYLGAFPQGW